MKKINLDISDMHPLSLKNEVVPKVIIRIEKPVFKPDAIKMQ